MIPFSPPHISERVIEELTAALNSGWITTGPRTKQFERQLIAYTGSKACLAINSATAGLEIMLRWFGVGEGDEVIVPAYTYCATANVVEHCGAKVVFADVHLDDFNISESCIEKLITPRTKVIIPVDFGGLPCNYKEINMLVQQDSVRSIFQPNTDIQKKLGRILVLSDAAHSIGAEVNGTKTGSLTDVSVFSFHAVKNITTAEGGAIMLNLPEPFNNQEIYTYLSILTLHGQNKDALAKIQKGNWKYDVIEPGFKCNMTDLSAAIGLIELERYDREILPARRRIIEQYHKAFKDKEWAETPTHKTNNKLSSAHLYPLRIKGITEEIRDRIIQLIFEQDVAVNVHFIPVPSMSYYKKKGYDITNYPITYYNFSREISLPVYEDLNEELVDRVITVVIQAIEQEIS